MLKIYDYLEAVMEEHNNRQWFFETRLNFFASEIMETLDIEDANEMATALGRALQVCGSLHIPVNNNFKKVFRFNGRHLLTDWKISSLACYLIIINCDPANEQVAKAQLFFAMNQAHK